LLEGAQVLAEPAPATKNVVIEVDELSKSYGSNKAVDQISFDVREGEILGFLGPNGAGKSTTLRILAGFLPGDSGRVVVNGCDVGTDSLGVRRSIGYLPEGVPVYPDLRVEEYLRFRAKLKGVPRRNRKRFIDEALEATQTTDRRKQIIGTLSRGYRQRVGLADALLSQPPVLILDEPTVGLDPEQVRQFRQLVRDVGKDRTVILSTHILSEVELICSNVVIIAGGRIVAKDSADRLRGVVGSRVSLLVEIDGPKDAVHAALRSIDSVQNVDVERASDDDEVRLEGVDASGKASSAASSYFRYRVLAGDGMAVAEEIWARVSSKGWKLRLLEREVLSMEDVFLDFVQGGGAS